MRKVIGCASVSHNEMWAIALAINNSLLILKKKNLSIDNYAIGKHETTSVIAEELAKVSFQGASMLNSQTDTYHTKFKSDKLMEQYNRRWGVTHR